MRACLPGLSLAAFALAGCTGTAGSGDAGPVDAADQDGPAGDGSDDSRPTASGSPLPAGVKPPRRLLDRVGAADRRQLQRVHPPAAGQRRPLVHVRPAGGAECP